MRNPSGSMTGGANNSAGKTITPCCSKVGIKRGPWTPQEDEILANYVKREGEGRWRTLPKRAGLLRCGKSCRLRWMNYLRPSVKRGHIAPDEEDLILRLHRLLGNRWALIAGRIPGRTDNEIKNYWNTHLSKKLISQGIDPRTHKPLQNWNPGPDDDAMGSFNSITPSHNPSKKLISQGINPRTHKPLQNWNSGPDDDAVGSFNSITPCRNLNPKTKFTGTDDSRHNQATASVVADYAVPCLETRQENLENFLENNHEDMLASFLDSLMNDDSNVQRQLRDAAVIGPPSPLPPIFPVCSSFNPSFDNGVTWGAVGFGSAMGELKSANQSNAANDPHA